MDIVIRRLATHAEYRAAEQIQVAAWNAPEAEIVPDQLLLTVQRHGGLVLGAFLLDAAGEQLIGIVLGLVALTDSGAVEHHSHFAAVLPAFHNQRIGERLKWAQREFVLAQGIDVVTWTYDPLESRNAALNIRKLGATCQTYLRDVYGPMRDALNHGNISDRFEVAWHVRSAAVAQRAAGPTTQPSLADWRQAGVPLLNPPKSSDPPRPTDLLQPLGPPRVLVAIPADFQALKATDPAVAMAWRMHTRAVFEAAFAAGYVVVHFATEPPLSYYLLAQPS